MRTSVHGARHSTRSLVGRSGLAVLVALTSACSAATGSTTEATTTAATAPTAPTADATPPVLAWQDALEAVAQAAVADPASCPIEDSDRVAAEVLTQPVTSVGVDRAGSSVAVTCDWGRPGRIELSLLMDGTGALGEYDGHQVLVEREADGLRVSVSAGAGVRVPVADADELLGLALRRLSA